jgi:hypothetical protein
MRLGRTLVIAGVAAVVVVGIPAYGYWHAATHGVVRVDVRDSAGHVVPAADAEVTLRDHGGRALAQFASDARVFFVSGPYSCRDIETRAPFRVDGHDAYARCFERQSRWVIMWAPDVSQADVRIGECRRKAVPARVSRRSEPSEWLLWWVPLPHSGGFPYTDFQVTIDVDACGRIPGPRS